MKYYLPYTDAVVDEDSSLLSSSTFTVPLGIPRSHGPNSSLHNNVQFAWDNTSLALYKTCPRKYQFTLLNGYVARVVPPALAFGIHLHTCFQVWHKLIASGVEKDTSLLRLVRLAGLLGETLPPGDTARTKETLVRSVVWYLEQFWEDKAKTVILSDGSPAVEYSFTLPFFQHKGQQVYLCGHIDRLVTWQGKVYVADYKTTKYTLDRKFFTKFKPSTQMALYTAACHIIAAETHDLPSADGVIIDGIQLGVNFSRYARNVVEFSLEEVEEYLDELRTWITNAMDAAEAGTFPANQEACGNYGGCMFQEICSKPAARRKAYLDGHFGKQTWDPLSSR